MMQLPFLTSKFGDTNISANVGIEINIISKAVLIITSFKAS
ncbi:hypothetical protein JCM19231_875 [Vibrio ishigakensis]|uniref:Uncharacterized protein n=1 Tax=Vibrio ishigakensis TaxID=1481914 RepID=A0A0B8NXI7_9VIBR|nr:hypothetical protein JCM19231_875 [Vibrio ishigakensis]